MQFDHRTLLTALPSGHIQSATRLGLVLDSDLDRDAWSVLVSHLARAAGQVARGTDTVTAWLGDVLAYGDQKYRGQISEYAKAAGLRPNTLRVAKLVCSRIPVLSRLNSLTWSHHCEVGRALVNPEEITRWLRLAEKEELSVSELRRRIRQNLRRSESSRSAAADAAPFTLLRELRAADRLVMHHGEVWKDWSPATCQLALKEIESLVTFVSELSNRAEDNVTRRTAG